MKTLISSTISKQIRSAAEPKYLYLSTGSTAGTFTSSGVLIAPTPIAQGVSNNQRIGDRVQLSELEVRYRFVVGTSPDAVRFFAWIYKPISDPASAPSALYPLYYNAAADYQTAMSPFDHKLSQVVTILKDWQYSLSTTGGGETNGNIVVGTFRIQLNQIQLYTGTTSTNQLYLSMIGEGTPNNTYVIQTRLLFYDV